METRNTGKGIDQDKLRAAIDKTCDDIFTRATEMIKQGVTAKMAYRLAISWELEINAYKTYAEITRAVAEMDQQADADVQKIFSDIRNKFDPNKSN